MQWKMLRVAQWMPVLGAKMTTGGQDLSKLDGVRIFIMEEDFFLHNMRLTKEGCPYLQGPITEPRIQCQVNKDSLLTPFLP